MVQPPLQRLDGVDDRLDLGDDRAGGQRRAGDGSDGAAVLGQLQAVAVAGQALGEGIGGIRGLGAEAGGLGVLGDTDAGADQIVVQADDHGDHALRAGEGYC